MALLILAGLLPAYLLRRAPMFARSYQSRRKQSLKIIGALALVGAIVFSLGEPSSGSRSTLPTAAPRPRCST